MAGCTQPGRQSAADSRRAMAQVVRKTGTTDASSARWCEAAGRLAASCAICKLPRTSSTATSSHRRHRQGTQRMCVAGGILTRPAPRGRRRDRAGRSHARVDRAHRDGIITGAGRRCRTPSRQPLHGSRPHKTPGPQIRGGTIDAVDAADDAMAEKLGGIERRGEHVAMRTAARSLRPHRPTAHATRQSGPDGSPLAAQLRDRHRPPRLATAESVARGRAAPARCRLSCPAGQHAVVASVSTSIRSLCTGWFRASNVITDAGRRAWLTS